MGASRVTVRSPSIFAAALLALATLVTPALSSAQQASEGDPRTPADEEVPGSRTRYAWGEGASSGTAPSGPAARRFARIFGSVGAGASLRLYYDPDPSNLGQDLLAPVYAQLRGGYFLESEGDLQHGFGLGIATNLTPDPLNIETGFYSLGQWTFAPSYFLRVWFAEEVQLLASFGVPIGISGDYQSIGLELSIGVIYKFLAGFGIYAQVTPSLYFAAFVQPLLSLDIGLVFDYEVLP